MTAVDWLGLLGVTMIGGSILIAIFAVTFAIVRDVRRALELRAADREPDIKATRAERDLELARILEPHQRRSEFRLLHGGRDPRSAA